MGLIRMGKKDEPKCETCGNFDSTRGRDHWTGSCCLDSMIVDKKETCWWHTEKENKEGKKLGDL